MENVLVDIIGLTKVYNVNAALNNLTLQIPKGKIIGLLGPNGSGKTTLIKILAGLLTPTSGNVTIDGFTPGVETKSLISYLPERTYFNDGMIVSELVDYFETFYSDFDKNRAIEMIKRLNISMDARLKTLSKGTKEKVQLVLVMSRRARLYLLDEPIGGVDPATREYILETIIGNYSPESTVLISTHLIRDIETVLDQFIFIQYGQMRMYDDVDRVREETGKSIDELFREEFRC